VFNHRDHLKLDSVAKSRKSTTIVTPAFAGATTFSGSSNVNGCAGCRIRDIT
jgi:hypothetical protein